jgi:DNA-binding NtrC family response regulator
MIMVAKSETLLIAEPVPKLADALEPWLFESGYAVKVVDNIKDILITLQSQKVRVLVMDACLLKGMGYEAISIFKGLGRNLPIIISTAQNNPEQESRIRQKGIFYYHIQSFGMDELILAVANAMARSFHPLPSPV